MLLFLKRARSLFVVVMEYVRYEDDEDDEDAATQYMIEQSLLESNKQKETQRGSTTPDSKSSEPESADSSAIFTAIRQGNEKLLKGLSVRQRDRFSQTDSRGWTPLHEAAAQRNQNILELTFKGFYIWLTIT
ncbi:hypothetical protein F7725_017473 [Dissostichus mawsoni]|uniref:ANK_REP_REGION domain-containing protein n=1 Tax=Dissostichus mawsoni TaxID=36200 RepID=A0A7J5Z580_DISMA|nr:hypothetical protein F7725_017473 [Dissostichus mawsoni]